jgi:hypothetical protein
MNRKLLFVGVILLAGALAVMAADSITGKWTYEQVGRGGGGGGGGTPRIITLDLKVAGTVVTGTILMPAGGRGGGGGGAAPAAPTPIEIKNGKVTGDSFTFDVVRTTQNGESTTKYEGIADGATLKLKVTAPGRGGGDPTTTEVVAKRA